MRGLAFPAETAVDRETSYEDGTPFSNFDDIPIDPALGGPAIDPALMDEGMNANGVQIQQEVHNILPYFMPPPEQYAPMPQYSQGPQGDPFAPQPPAAYFPIELEQPVRSLKPVKRKRKPPREKECGFCQGNDAKNKVGQPEKMAMCNECSRSGHPSCMELSGAGDVLQSYPWKCIECKDCEVCHEKGDDERILFCDFCDRGWHMDCLVPPLEETPKGRWYCPACPQSSINDSAQPEFQPEDLQPHIPPLRESSVASSSRSVMQPTMNQSKQRSRGKGKAKAAVMDDLELDVDVDVEGTPKATRSRGKTRSHKKGGGIVSREEQYSDDDERTIASPRQTKRMRVRVGSPTTPLPRVRLRLPAHSSKGKEREDDEPKGMFDEILTIDDRDISKTTILNGDKQRFERSRVLAEEKIVPPAIPPPPATPQLHEALDVSTPGPSSRPLRSSTLQHISTISASTPTALSASPGPSTPGGPFTKVDPSTLRIRTIRFGQFDIKTWYDAPFPEEYANIPDGRLWICEFCLKYMKSRFGAVRHRMKCKARHPPGDEIYRDGIVSIFEVDGRKNKIYCQNLCLLSKMFLDHKSLFYDVEPFLFYVITEMDDFGARFVGYFSKEKRSPKDYNVSCIMTLPVRQRQGWGNLLIDFSYLLSKKEQRPGSPEKPLSSLGALGYRNYWTLALMRFLETAPDQPRLEDISVATSMTIEDIHNTLVQQNMISFREPTPPPIKPIPGQSIKFPKGRKNGVARRHLQRTQTNDKDVEVTKGPFIAPTHYEIQWDRDKVDKYLKGWEAKGYLKLKPERLQWSPYLLTRTRRTEAAKITGSTALKSTDDLASGSSTVVNGAFEGSSTFNDVSLEQPIIALNGDTLEEAPTTEIEPGAIPAEGTTRVETYRLFSQEPNETPTRRLRSRSSQISGSSTREAANARSLRTRRGSRTIDKKPDVAEELGLAEDDALFAHLGSENSQGRQLRSGVGKAHQESKNNSLVPTTRSRAVSPRKRRRVESSSEDEGSLPVPSSTKLRSEKETAFIIPDRALESAAAAGFLNSELPPRVCASSEFETHADVEPGLPIKPTAVENKGVVTETSEKTTLIPEVDSEPDVKSEDLGTPLTSLTSRQSLPSDDTSFVADGAQEGKEVSGEAEMDGEGDGDGEFEEDAEGEPDEEFL